MKKIIIMALSLMLVGNSYAESERKVDSEIKEVTIFLQGAQIHRRAKVSLPKGVTKVIFEGMASSFNKNSIQVKGKGDFVIMDVSSQLFYPVPEPVKIIKEIPAKIIKETRMLQDSMTAIGWKQQALTNDIAVYNSEKQILLGSGVIKGQGNNDSIPALVDAMDYLRLKMIEINGLLLKAQIKQSEYASEKARMTNRLAELQNYQNNQNLQNQNKNQNLGPVQQIVITVSADYATSGYMDLNYMVTNAGWSPSYDLRADDIASPVKLTYKANVYQNTGVNWDNVEVKLSTINPNRSNVKPVLAPWYVDFYRPIQQPVYNGRAYAQPTAGAVSDDYSLKESNDVEMNESVVATPNKDYYSKMPASKQISNYTQMSENMAMVEFELKLKQSIPSDGQNHMMAVKSDKIKSSFEHFIVPKLDTDAFLVAHLTDWEELNLLPAVANIYYDGTYVGQTRINPSVMSDTLDLALGRDNGIYVTRKKKSDEEKVKALSSEKSKTITYEIAIKNYKGAAVNLTIEDQIPITVNKEIEVEVGSIDKAEHNKDNGTLIWKRKIESKATEKLRFTYTLRYDKDKQLAANY